MTTKTLYAIRIEAEPQPAHPQFWEIDRAFIDVYLFALRPELVEERARAFLSALNWEAGETVRLGTVDLNAAEANPDVAPWVHRAFADGIAFRAMCLMVGASDGESPRP